jgi:hypothetical protein
MPACRNQRCRNLNTRALLRLSPDITPQPETNRKFLIAVARKDLRVDHDITTRSGIYKRIIRRNVVVNLRH